MTAGFGTADATTTAYVRDALGRLVRVIDALGQVTSYAYEPGGQLAQARQTSADGRRSQTRSWSFNSLGWLTATTQPERGTTLYRDFTVTGQPRSTVFQGDGHGPARELRTTYDDLMRVRAVASSDGSVAQSFGYDAAQAGGRPAEWFGRGNGRLTYARDGATERFRSYRGPGGSLSDLETRVWSGGQAGIGVQKEVHQGFEYDGFGLRVGHQVGDHALTTGFDPALGLPVSAALNQIPVATGVRGAGGLMTGLKFLYGVQAGFKFGADQTRLQALQYGRDSGAVGRWDLAYDGRGQLRSDGENSYPECDPLGRVLKAIVPRLRPDALVPDPAQAVTQACGYDGFGNLIGNLAAPLDAPDGANQTNFRFDDSEQAALAETNRLPRSASGVPTGAEYDAQGNLTGIFKQASSVKPQRLALAYDALGRVTAVTDEARGTGERFGYSPEGLRTVIQDTQNGQWVKTRFNLYDDVRRLVSQYEGPGAGAGVLAWERDFIYLGQRQVGELDARGLHVILADPLGTPRYVVDAGGGVTGAQKFLPFGETLDQGGTQLPGKGFTNHEQTEATGLIYMQGRFYLPQYHRFTSPDPALDQHPDQPQSWNLYSYALNSPAMLTDPSGMAIPWYFGGDSTGVDRFLTGMYSAAVTNPDSFTRACVACIPGQSWIRRWRIDGGRCARIRCAEWANSV